MVNWIEGEVSGCSIRPLKVFTDARGWLGEFFRIDEIAPEMRPEMGYVSVTKPGVARGPHEHRDQTDLFVFFDGEFRLYLWDSRAGSPTYGVRQAVHVGRDSPAVVIVPPGVVHAYRNVGAGEALIINCPNRLYAGWGRADPVDEIRHEDRAGSSFLLD